MIFESALAPLLGFFSFLLVFTLLGLFLCVLLFWIWMLLDCLQREFATLDPNTKLLWVLVILLGGFFGALLYFILVKKDFSKPSFLS